ncbi:MAG: hypothetical protein JNM25_00415 [Planctomycetes bacterium]|nr:hypothetical protein [Planctomycetota bacterium]
MSLDLAALTACSTAALQALCAADGLETAPAAEHGELLRTIVQHRLASGATAHVHGVLEVLPDGFGFVRSPRFHLAPQPLDAFVNQAQIRHLNLKTGHRLSGPLRAPRPGERFFSVPHIDEVNGGAEPELAARVPFAAQTPVLPTRPLPLDAGGDLELRAIELLAPWARGHRALLRLPPGADGGALLARLAAAMRRRDAKLVLLLALVDQRPEALAAAQRTLAGTGDTTVLGTTFDEPPARHVALAEFALQMAQREVEAGRDVVLLVDDLVHLARAGNLALAPSGRLLCAGLDAAAVLLGKRVFAAARACEAGGSLTVLATAVAGDHAADRAIAGQFERRGNSEVAFTAGPLPGEARLDATHTFTRSEDLLLPPPLAAAWRRLHHELRQLPAAQRSEVLFARLTAQPDSTALLRQLAATPSG